MTGKRFVDYFDKDHNYIIQDLQNEDEYQVGFVNCDEDVFLELINQLNDENEQLKQSNERIIKDIDLALGFIKHKGYSLQDIKDYEDAKKEYEEDLANYRKGDVE